MSDTGRNVRAIIADILEQEVASVQPETKLGDLLQIDSVAVLEILVALERHYQIKISEQEIKMVVTVQDIINLVENK